MSDANQPVEPGLEQPFIAHLIELRDRMLRIVIALIVVVIALSPFANDIYTFVAGPLIKALPEGSQMISTGVAAPFLVPLKLAVIAAVFLTIPYTLYQLWSFIAPGLYAHEKKLALPLLVASVALFYCGVAFAYFAVFPLMFGFFATVAPEGVTVMPDIAAYLDFAMSMFLAFGAVFEIPIAVIFMVLIGITTVDALAEKRPYVIVGAFVVAMFLTPPDVVSQTSMAVPMWFLFELGLVFARIMLKFKKQSAAERGEQSLD
jgi:sec-independent protein translocase protein TatC